MLMVTVGSRHFKCAEEMPEQNPEDVYSQAGYVWECANTDCLDTSFEWMWKKNTPYTFSVFMTLSCSVFLPGCVRPFSPFTLCTARYSVFVTPLKHIHTYHTSYVSLIFTYLPYIIYLVLIPPPVIELYFSPTPSLFCHYIHMPCLPPMYAHPPNLCSL